MNCGDGTLLGNSIDLEKELNDNNARVMAVQTSLGEQIGGSIQFGKRVDLFWVIMSVIIGAVLISISIFGKKRKRR